MSEMFIYCDDASHRRRTAVVTFVGSETGWTRISRPIGISESVTLDKDDHLKGTPEYRVYTDARTGRTRDRLGRSRERLVCWRCKERPLVVRREKLFLVLDQLVLQGVSEVPLRLIAAMLAVQSRSD